MLEPLTVHFQNTFANMSDALERSASLRNPHAISQASMAASAAGYDARAMTCVSASQELIGVWPLSVRKPLPWLQTLKSPVIKLYDISGSPMIMAGHELPVLQAMFDHLREASSAPKVLLINNLPAEGLVWEALIKLEDSGSISLDILESWQRAIFDRTVATDTETYFSTSLSGSTRKRLRKKRHALEEGGEITLLVRADKDTVELGLNHFLQLEQAGWKGNGHSALQQHPADARYFLNLLKDMAAVDRAFVAELLQGERTIAAGLFLRCAGDVFFIKTTYDETLSKHSPGVIFDMMLTEYLYQQPWFERLDTSTDSSIDPASFFWKQRQKMANIVIDCNPSSLHGQAVVASQRLRIWLKQLKNRTTLREDQTEK